MSAPAGNSPVPVGSDLAKTGEWKLALRSLLAVLALLVLTIIGIAAMGSALNEPEFASDVISLAIPAFVAGFFSILSPCSLPIVIGYFSLVVREHRQEIGVITIAFLLGVGTTMAVIGAGFTALGSLVIDYQERLAQIGGVLIIIFGFMSIFGKGFGGMTFLQRPSMGTGGAYVYGLIFALGWTTCVGPILGSILTLLLAEGNSASGALSLVAGATLSLVYVLGLGLPILLLVGAISSAGPTSRVARVMRGKGWEVSFLGHTFYFHSTSVISGLLLILLGILLMSGQMTALSQQLASSPLTELGIRIEEWLNSLF